MRRYYSELIFQVTDGDPSAMQELRRFDIFEFFRFIDNYENKIKNARH
jgi:hypothetical protein